MEKEKNELYMILNRQLNHLYWCDQELIEIYNQLIVNIQHLDVLPVVIKFYHQTDQRKNRIKSFTSQLYDQERNKVISLLRSMTLFTNIFDTNISDIESETNTILFLHQINYHKVVSYECTYRLAETLERNDLANYLQEELEQAYHNDEIIITQLYD